LWFASACASPHAETEAPETEARGDNLDEIESSRENTERGMPGATPAWDADFDVNAGDRARGQGRFAPPPPGDERWFDDESGAPAVAWRNADDAVAELQGLEQRLAAAGVAMPASTSSTAALRGAITDTVTLGGAAGAGGGEASPEADRAKPANEKSGSKRTKKRKGKKRPSTSRDGRSSRPNQPTSPGGSQGTDGARPEEEAREAPKKDQADKQAESDNKNLSTEDATVAANAEAGWCENVCELTSAICSLELRICDMASRNPADERYGAACARARLDCSVATDACNECSAPAR
jgi:hypothetical protein